MECESYFDCVAHEWDRMRAAFFPDAVREKVLEIAGPLPGALAADIGAGTGFITEGLLERGLRVIAVDQSQAMIDELKRKFSGHKHLECRLGEALELPIESGTIDYAFANMFLHHVDDPAGAVMEIGRIVRRGGHVVITDIDKHDYESLRTEHHDRWPGFRREDLGAWLHDAGFDKVRVESLGHECCADSKLYPECSAISIFMASGVMQHVLTERGTLNLRAGIRCCS
ncbi:MAG TPA: class I SAM-dependent methyltransferase [Acidobacteriota bacterium]|nr:class I SAM-dependent methyltransferase [Acidobacteriota bacterium]